MKPLRIAHLADTHLGYRALFKSDPVSGRNQRAVDFERAYQTAVDDILTRGVDLVVHAGDVFHHTRPSWAAIRAFVRQTRRLSEAGLPLLVIGGNHDTPRLRTSGSVFSVLELALPGTRFVTGYEQEGVEFPALDLLVTAIPHGKLVDPLGPSAVPAPGVRNVLVTHGMVAGLKLKGRPHEPGEEDVADFLLGEDFDYIALGHYHVFDRVRANAWYSGSTERTGWGDEDVDPGYALVEIGEPGAGAAATHIPVGGRPMRTLAAVDGEGLAAAEIAETVLAEIGREVPADGMARVELRNTPRVVRRETERLLRRAAADLVWSLQVFSPADILAGFGERSGDGVVTDIGGLFEEFLGQRDFDPAFSDAFRLRGRQALEDAARTLEHADATEDSAA